MISLSSLPRTLLALALITLATVPVLTVGTTSIPTSSNDPFRAVVLVHRTRQPEPPLCCLKPLPTVDPPEGPEDVLLSFEEWKSKQLHASLPSSLAKSEVKTPDGNTPVFQNTDAPVVDGHSPPEATPDDTLPPHFRVPIVDRFDYANLDCSARVHTSHKSAKSVSSILSSKKDKYMLSPCSDDPQFVVVELCDDIRIDTVQLANFEFFSGVFKDFSVSVAKTYTGTDEGWTPAGTYRAKNIRGVQSFHPPTSLHDFYRYIRIDFHSHYGHEYYCPISLLRVYGLTHLEEWKWDTWQAESRARPKDSATQRSLITEYSTASDATVPNVSTDDAANASVTQRGVAKSRFNATSQPLHAEVAQTTALEEPSSRSLPPTQSQGWPASHVSGEGASISSNGDRKPQTLGAQSMGVQSITEAISSLSTATSPSIISPSQPTAEHTHVHSYDPEIHPSSTLSSQPSNPSAPPPLVQQTPTHAQPPLQWAGESIYRTIMNRLTTLEANHTLHARYVEEQTTGVREVLRKLNEEVGRLESVSRMQAQMYQRTVHEWERQRLRLELEHGELLSRVNYLSDEIALEKRLGIAQLCLLLAVLVFIGLTRGAPAQQLAVHRPTGEWGVRKLSFGSSPDRWSGSLSPAGLEDTKEKATEINNSRPLFPDSTGSPGSKYESHTTTHNLQHISRTFKLVAAPMASSSHKRMHAGSVFRTPTKPRSLTLIEPHTLPRAEPITRSHSSSTSGHFHGRSAKHWARTAHLHEIKVFHDRRGSGSGKRSGTYKDRESNVVPEGSLDDDVFNVSLSMSPSRVKAGGKSLDAFRRPFTPFEAIRRSDESVDADGWMDTDMDVGDENVSVASERVGESDSPERDYGRIS